MISKDRLKEYLAQLLDEREKATANLNAVHGAVQAVQKLLSEIPDEDTKEEGNE